MTRVTTISSSLLAAATRCEEAVYWAAGATFTLGLFITMAHFERAGVREREVEIEDMPIVALPSDAPPPNPDVARPTEVAEDAVPLAGIEVERTDSPVKIAVVPPDLEAFLPDMRIPPRAMVQFSRVYTELKPRIDTDVNVRRVYQTAEVDQPPRAIVRVAPPVPDEAFGGAKSLRVVLLLVIDVTGRAETVRVSRSSGQASFDAIVAQTVRDEWMFSPAIRRGKKVKCLAEQGFRVNLSNGSPFSTE